MRGRQLKQNSVAISSLIVALIAIVVIASVVALAITLVLFGFWSPFGQVVGSGTLDTEMKDFTDFTVVEVGWGFKTEIYQSDSYSINLTADNNIFDYIEVSHSGDTLTIGLKWGYSYQNVTLRAEITMPDIYRLELSGGVMGNISGFTSSHDFFVELSGGSHLNGFSCVANELTVSGSGGCHLDFSDFIVHNATVNLSGGSHATINLNGRLDGNLSGGSHLKYLGNPTVVDVNTSGGSIVGPQ